MERQTGHDEKHAGNADNLEFECQRYQEQTGDD